ncbi:hypothetical protein BKA65DRAFT_600535 [Rhexocercosporidium sp. MPI-PUGE-AT-0058]|nr:hypothetical protein BKA65DRAFT_600535 [Rhexocercosporidium sp. MPI-PUGE-AT-0058]
MRSFIFTLFSFVELTSLGLASTLPLDILPRHDLSTTLTTLTSTTAPATSCTSSLSTPSTSPTLTPHILNTFPPGTWLENLVIRQSDANALITLLSSPTLLLLSTTSSFPPQHIASIPEALGCLGIVELYHDIFYIVAGNWTAKTGVSTPGSYGVWEIDMRDYKTPSPHQDPDHGYDHSNGTLNGDSSGEWNSSTSNAPGIKKRKIASLPHSGFLNGMTILNPVSGTLLIADSLLGLVWSVNVLTGRVTIAINDTSMAPLPNSTLQLGINGLLVRDGYLYFDNTNRAGFYRVPIDLQTGARRGDVEVLVQSDIETIFPDDFTIDFVGNVWMTADVWGRWIFGGVAAVPSSSSSSSSSSSASSNSTDDAGEDDADLEIVAGSKGDEYITGWTAAKFGTRREDLQRGSLYVTTNGGPVNYYYGNWTSGGMLIRLDAVELDLWYRMNLIQSAPHIDQPYLTITMTGHSHDVDIELFNNSSDDSSGSRHTQDDASFLEEALSPGEDLPDEF